MSKEILPRARETRHVARAPTHPVATLSITAVVVLAVIAYLGPVATDQTAQSRCRNPTCQASSSRTRCPPRSRGGP